MNYQHQELLLFCVCREENSNPGALVFKNSFTCIKLFYAGKYILFHLTFTGKKRFYVHKHNLPR